MSNSFDGGNGAERNGLSTILAAIAGELGSAASDLASLGESLSGGMSDPEVLRKNYDLQAFDALSQAVHAQARLLRRLSECDREGAHADIATMIEDVPFLKTRQRLLAAVNGSALPAASDETDDTEVNWF
jgi:hypothetical protein